MGDLGVDYLVGQSAVAVRLTHVLHGERVFVASSGILDEKASGLQKSFKECEVSIAKCMATVESLCNNNEPDIAAVLALVTQRMDLREAGVATLAKIVDTLSVKKDLFRSRTATLEADITELIEAHESTKCNPLKDADEVSSYAGLSKVLYDVHRGIQEAIEAQLTPSRLDELRAMARYPAKQHIDDEIARYTRILADQRRLLQLEGRVTELWGVLQGLRKELILAQDTDDDLWVELRKLKRRNSLSLDATNDKAQEINRMERAISDNEEAMSALKARKDDVISQLQLLLMSTAPEAYAIRPPSVPQHVGENVVVATRSLGQFARAVPASKRVLSLFEHAPLNEEKAHSLRFEGQLAQVEVLPGKVELNDPRLLSLRHPHDMVDNVTAAFNDESGESFYVQSNTMARSLRDWMALLPAARGPVKTNGAKIFFTSLLRGLAHMHKHNAPHGLLIPSAIKIDDVAVGGGSDDDAVSKPQISLAGLCHDLDASVLAKVTLEGMLRFVPPEQREPQPDGLSHKEKISLAIARDLYATGIMLYEIFFGVHPGDTSAEIAENPTGTLLSTILNPDPSKRPRDVEALLMHAFFTSDTGPAVPFVGGEEPQGDGPLTSFYEKALAAQVDVETKSMETTLNTISTATMTELKSSDAMFDLSVSDSPMSSDLAWTTFFESIAGGLFENTGCGRSPAPSASAEDCKAVGRAIQQRVARGKDIAFDLAPSVVAFLLGLEPRRLAWEEVLLLMDREQHHVASQLRAMVASKLDDRSKHTLGAYLGNDNATVITDKNKEKCVVDVGQHLLVECRRGPLEALREGMTTFLEDVKTAKLSLIETCITLRGLTSGLSRDTLWELFATEGLPADSCTVKHLARFVRLASDVELQKLVFALNGIRTTKPANVFVHLLAGEVPQVIKARVLCSVVVLEVPAFTEDDFMSLVSGLKRLLARVPKVAVAVEGGEAEAAPTPAE